MVFYRLVFFALLASAVGAPLRGQTEWARVPSHVAENLWGVCFGGGQFVAVGEGGTILTSPDGLVWTSRTSGTKAWLTSVAYGLGNYIAVGDAGTVLASHDAVTWENLTARVTDPPSERLDVVAFFPLRASFLAYGEHDAAVEIFFPGRLDWIRRTPGMSPGTWWRSVAIALDRILVGGETGLAVLDGSQNFFPGNEGARAATPVRNVSGLVFDRGAFTAVGGAGAIVTSVDGVRWAAQSSGTSANLQGLASFNNTLIAVGEGGTILSQDALGLWQRGSAPTVASLWAIAASDTAVVIVGGNGTILRSTAAPMPPVIIEAPASVTETLGGAAAFAVRANGSLPLQYQWSHNGVALAGETRDTFVRTPLAAVDAGSYTVTITNSAGTTTSSVAVLGVLPAPAPIVDESFAAVTAVTGAPSALLPLADGSVLVADAALLNDGKPRPLVKLRKDGSLDTAWAGNLFGGMNEAGPPRISVLVAQPDGRILAGGSFATLNGAARPNLVRLNSDGTLDTSFAPASEATARPVTALALHADGRIVLANGGTTPVRLLADGRLDAAFQPEPLPPETVFSPNDRNWSINDVDITSDNRIVVGARVVLTRTNARPQSDGMVARLRVDGTRDASFAAYRWSGSLLRLRTLEDDGVLLLASLSPPTGGFFSPVGTRAVRLDRDGHVSSIYASPVLANVRASFIYRDGRVLYSAIGEQSPARLTASGTPDPGFTGGVGDATALAPTADGHVFVAGVFPLYNAKAADHVVRLNAVPNESLNAPRILRVEADKTAVNSGEVVTLRAVVVGSAEMTYEWSGLRDGPNSTPRTALPTITTTFQPPSAAPVRLVARNPRGSATSATVVFTVLPESPRIVSQPTRISAPTGRDVTMVVEKNATSGAVEFEWRRDGEPLARAGAGTYVNSLFLTRVTAADAGSYTLTLRNVLGDSITSAPIVLTIDDVSRFANLSTRAFVGPGEQTLIAGFTISGRNARTVLVRGIGPALTRFGVADALADPQVQLFDANGHARSGSFSDDWDEASSRAIFEQVGAFPLDAGSRDAAFTAILEPGSYTVQLVGKPGQTGTALVEIYENDNDAARLLNLSTRAFVRPGSPAISGLVVQGAAAKRVLLRAAGPSLGTFGIAGVLTNPRLVVKNDAGATVATNDDWETNANRGELRAVTTAVGAFPLADASRDAALLVTLAPGAYTLVVDDADGAAGIVLVEAYEVP